MPIATAPLLIDAATLTPARFGLLSAAQFPDTPDLHWADGVEYPTNPRPAATAVAVDCEPADLTALVTDIDTSIDAPLRVWSTLAVKRPAWTDAELDARVRAMLTAGEGPALEAAVWPLIADASAATPAGAAPVSILSGVGALEAWLWEAYGGVGVLHVSRSAIPHLVRAKQVREVNGHLQTPLGTLVSAGAYPGSGVAGAAPAAGAVWIAATPAVQLRRTPIRAQASFNHRTNEATFVADRVYVPSWESLSAIAQIQLEVQEP